MRDSDKLKEYLIREGITTEEHFKQALECISTGSVSLDKALVSLNLVDYAELGGALSALYNLPYVPVLSQPVPDAAMRLFSRQCSKDWDAIPVDYDSDEDLLTLAVHDPEQIVRLQRIHRFFMQPYSVAFTIVSEGEMEEVINPTSGSDQSSKEPIREPKPKVDDERPRAKMKMAIGAGIISGFSYTEMARALVSSAALAAQLSLGDDEEKLLEVRTRVRYCQLLGSRLSLSAIQTDGLTLAAWLSGLGDDPDGSKSLVTPYGLEDLLSPKDIPLDEQRAEAQILSLVRCYEDLGKQDPDACRDVNLTRRHFHSAWSSSPSQQDMLETFLQVLMDEEFLSKLDHVMGHILIVDPDQTAMSLVSAPLASEGYKIAHAGSSGRAATIMAETTPDLILCATKLPSGDGLSLCQKIKQTPETANIPFVLMGGGDDANRAAECLRAGADDFLTKPVDIEILFLKLHRLIASPEAEAAEAGVSGNLQDMSFTDMIQIICAGGKSMEITLRHEELLGKVWVETGNIVHASVEDMEGPPAFYSMMQWREGKFTTSQCSEFPNRTVDVSAMALLMEGSRLADESREEEAAAS